MTKREFLDIVFALAPTEANAIMDAFDEYVDSNEPHWIPVTERLPEKEGRYLVTNSKIGAWHVDVDFYRPYMGRVDVRPRCNGMDALARTCKIGE